MAFTTFTRSGSRGMVCRLVVRRVKPLRPAASDGTVQGELFAAHRHHAFITNSTLSTIEADEHHRDHAVVEQVIAELKDGPLAHLPSGRYAANAAWVAMAVIAFNLARAAAVAAGQHKARWASLRTRIINIPARIAATGRRLILHLPRLWPWPPPGSRSGPPPPGPPHPPRPDPPAPTRARPRTSVEKPAQAGRPNTPQTRTPPKPDKTSDNHHRWIRAQPTMRVSRRSLRDLLDQRLGASIQRAISVRGRPDQRG